MIDSDRQFRHEKGLCFRCGSKFVTGHKCQSATLTTMESSTLVMEHDDGELPDDNSPHGKEEPLEISFNAISGKNPISTMKWKGTIQDRDV